MYYNPQFEAPKARFYGISKVEPKWVEAITKIKTGPFAAFQSYEEALNSNYTGKLRWWQNGVMYEGSHVPASYYKPCVGVQHEFGINWDTWYACDVDILMDTLKTKYNNLYDAEPKYSEEFGVWSIQVHYDGRCR